MTSVQFGVNVHGTESFSEFEDLVRRADDLGCDVFAAPDHLGALAPFSALTAAGAISSRLRLRTYVLNTGFWNPALLAREVATLDVLSGGRAEIGLGAGHMKGEHDEARIPWRGFPERVRVVEGTLLELRRRLSDADHRPRPVQASVPIMVGAMSEAGLRVAAGHADVVGFAGLKQGPGAPAGRFTLSSSEETADRVRLVREHAGGRSYRSDALLQVVTLGSAPANAAARIASTTGVDADLLLDSPFALLARGAPEAADALLERSERYGFDSFITHQPHLEALGEVIAAHRTMA